MRKIRHILAAATLILSTSAKAGVTIYGNAPSYAGKTLSVRTYSDQILYNEDELGQAKVSENGDFEFDLPVTTTMQVFIPMPTYKGFIYIEPNKKYKISLPEYCERTLQQKLSPYFAVKDYLLTIEDLERSDLNYQMMEFDDGFDFYSMKHITYGAQLDSVKKSVGQMRDLFVDLNKPFQQRFKEYRYLLLLNMAAKTSALQDSMIVRLNKMGVETENPAFWDAMNNIFDDFVAGTKGTEEYELFKRIINVGDSKMLLGMLNERYGLSNKELREMVAIKICGDLLNHADFDRGKVIALLLGLKSYITDSETREILNAQTNKACLNYIGTNAPDFEGTTSAGKVLRLSEQKGKYVYLNFCNSHLEKTVRDLQVLQRFAETFQKELTVINIFLYDKPEDVKRLEANTRVKMQYVTVPQPDLLRQYYGVKSVPSYMILDTEGQIMMTKGAEPNDDLRLFMQTMLKK